MRPKGSDGRAPPASTVDRCSGTYPGAVVADDGEVRVDDRFGWAEEAGWRW